MLTAQELGIKKWRCHFNNPKPVKITYHVFFFIHMSDSVIFELRKLLELALANGAAEGSMIRMGQLE